MSPFPRIGGFHAATSEVRGNRVTTRGSGGLYSNAPNVRLVRIDDSRHFIQWDEPARFTAEIDAFMTR